MARGKKSSGKKGSGKKGGGKVKRGAAKRAAPPLRKPPAARVVPRAFPRRPRKPHTGPVKPAAAPAKPGAGKYDLHLGRNPANFVPLTPLQFLERAAATFPGRPSVVHGRRRYTWGETYERARRMASALAERGIKRGATVAVMAPNIPELYEAHFGVPMAGAVLNALNTRLNAKEIAFILAHGETELIFCDTELSPTIKGALAELKRDIPVIDIVDSEGPGGERIGEIDYEASCRSRPHRRTRPRPRA